MVFKSKTIFAFFILLIFLSTCSRTGQGTSLPTPDDKPITETQEMETQPALPVTQYPRICETTYSPREFSPDRSWMVELCYSDVENSLILTYSNRDTKVLWKIDYRDYIQTTDGFLPDGGLSVVHWSTDGRYSYFNSYISGSGGECFFNGNVETYGKGLFRLDLKTGEVSTVLPLRDNFMGYDFSFAPTGGRLVYDTYGSGMKILDLQTGHLTDIAPVSQRSDGGGYLWSLDGLELVYSTVLYNDRSEPVAYSLRRADAISGVEQLLLESPDRCFEALKWDDDSMLLIRSEAVYGTVNNTLIEYDLSTKQIIVESTTTALP